MPPDHQLRSVSVQNPFSLIPEVLPVIACFLVPWIPWRGGIWNVPAMHEPNPGCISLRWPRRRRLGATLDFLSCQAVMSATNYHVSLENNWKAAGIVFSPSGDSAPTHARPASH